MQDLANRLFKLSFRPAYVEADAAIARDLHEAPAGHAVEPPVL
jgi:hypothetical protein